MVFIGNSCMYINTAPSNILCHTAVMYGEKSLSQNEFLPLMFVLARVWVCPCISDGGWRGKNISQKHIFKKSISFFIEHWY